MSELPFISFVRYFLLLLLILTLYGSIAAETVARLMTHRLRLDRQPS